MIQRALVLAVVLQHAQDAVDLRHMRRVLVRAPHVQLHRLQRLDERLAAHLDGLWTAGPQAKPLVQDVLAEASAGAVFVAAVMALQARDAAELSRLVAVAAADPVAEHGWLSALGWVSPEDLQGTVKALLGSQVRQHRVWGLEACAMHQVDPGALLLQALDDADPACQAAAWRVAGKLGRTDLAARARDALARGAATQAAAWALSLWGQGQDDSVLAALLQPAPGQALPEVGLHRMAFLSRPVDWGREQVRALAALAESSMLHKRRMVRAAGWVGDPQIVPWLIQHMGDDVWARLAGEAFSLITGADLAALGLERSPPEAIDFGPAATEADQDTALDEDDSLPWPDQVRVQAWWQSNAARFAPGQRYFGGSPPSEAQALQVLRQQGQRQRIMAAEHLCLLRPGAKLFVVAAPAWRQQRWLAAGAAGVPA